jgi:hypothetical protein
MDVDTSDGRFEVSREAVQQGQGGAMSSRVQVEDSLARVNAH